MYETRILDVKIQISNLGDYDQFAPEVVRTLSATAPTVGAPTLVLPHRILSPARVHNRLYWKRVAMTSEVIFIKAVTSTQNYQHFVFALSPHCQLCYQFVTKIAPGRGAFVNRAIAAVPGKPVVVHGGDPSPK